MAYERDTDLAPDGRLRPGSTASRTRPGRAGRETRSFERAREGVPNDSSADRRVIFRATAPEAQKVAVVGHAADSGMNGNTPYEMKKRADGIWEVTTGPVRPGFHYYELIIDGHRTTDPASQTYFGWAKQTSGLEVPDPELDFYEAEGCSSRRGAGPLVLSKTTGQHRQAVRVHAARLRQRPEASLSGALSAARLGRRPDQLDAAGESEPDHGQPDRRAEGHCRCLS